MISDELKKILESDDGLLDTPPKKVPLSSEDRLVNSFLEINTYIEVEGHIPYPDSDNIKERQLFSRLRGIVSEKSKIYILKPYDTYDILKPINEPKTVENIIANNDFGILDTEAEDIFKIKNLPKEISKPDYIGRQRKCLDFDKYEHLFISCHQDIKNGKRKIIEFSHQNDIVEGNFFVLKGLLVYVDKVGDKAKSVNRLDDARLRLIYENGTESDILLLSFAKALFLDGKLVTEHEDRVLDNFKGIDHTDSHSGYIYVLKSLSKLNEIQSLQNLFKIGFTTQEVKDRLRDAEKDPTYLMAPVEIIATYRCYNMSVNKLEHMLHRIFSDVRLDLEITGLSNKKFKANEWFIAPLEAIDKAISLIISDEIINYRYDSLSQDFLKIQ